jgi:hypothetical protein
MRYIHFGLLGVLGCLGSTSAQAAQYLGAGVSVSTYGYLTDPSSPQFSSSYDSSLTLRNLSAAANKQISDGAHSLYLQTAATVQFTNANKFLLQDSSSLNFSSANPFGLGGYGQVGANFYYSFSLARSEKLTINYSMSKAIDPIPFFGVNGDPARVFLFNFDPSGPPSPGNIITASPNTSGVFQTVLGPGTYSLGILTILNGTPFGGNALLTGSTRFDVNFGSAAVPDAPAWMTLIAGFGLIGAFMRKQRNKGLPSQIAN